MANPRMLSPRRLGSNLALLGLAACGADALPPDTEAVALALVTQPSAEAQSGVPLAEQPVVELRNGRSEPAPVRGVLVTATLASGGGTLGGTPSVRTDGQGRARFADLTITGPVGPRTLRFDAAGRSPAISRDIVLGAGVPERMVPHAGNNQTAAAGTALPEVPAVRVTDGAGNPVPEESVAFAITAGGGVVTGASPTTGPDGVARVAGWTLGPRVGPNTLTATARSLRTVFAATGIVGPPARLTIVEGSGQAAAIGAPVALAPAVKVTDAFDNAIGGVAVAFAVATGAGVVSNPTPLTDAAGVARVGAWTLGLIPGAQALTASRELASVGITATATDFPVQTVTAGGFSSCALGPTGLAYCWGANADGQLGDGTTVPKSLPTAVQGGRTYRSITIGQSHTCALTPAGEAYCWGLNAVGQLGDGTTVSRSTPVLVGGSHVFALLATGDAHSCGLDVAGLAWCWGANGSGRLGDGTTTPRGQPTAVQGGHVFTAIATGGAHTCALRADAQVLCWGNNGSGRLGDGTTTDRLVPTPVTGGPSFGSVTAGGFHSCGVDQAGAGFCWGSGAGGLLGTGNVANQLVPAAVAGGLVFTSIVAGNNHTCGITTAAAVSCWGLNGNGRLGDGTTVNRLVPAAVALSLTASALRPAAEHTCARTSLGSAVCWGRGLEGQMGDGSTSSRLTPVGATRP